MRSYTPPPPEYFLREKNWKGRQRPQGPKGFGTRGLPTLSGSAVVVSVPAILAVVAVLVPFGAYTGGTALTATGK